MSVELPHVFIYTDGACHPNPGRGGWAALLRFGKNEKVLVGGDPHTTNNRMELTAALEALRALKQPCEVDFFTDSEYLRRGITEWMPRWRVRNWRRKGGELANIDIWRDLETVIQPHHIRWNWVRGHAGHPENERVDALARDAALSRS